jgi:hypothetical protein
MCAENGDGRNRAAAPATRTRLHASATAGALRCPRADAEVRLKETAGAQGAATRATAREKDENDHHDYDRASASSSGESARIWQPNQCLRSAEPDLRHSRGGASISKSVCAAIEVVTFITGTCGPRWAENASAHDVLGLPFP